MRSSSRGGQLKGDDVVEFNACIFTYQQINHITTDIMYKNVPRAAACFFSNLIERKNYYQIND